jgi:Holliday junction resolvase
MVYVEAKSVDSTIDRGIERQIATALSLLNTTPVLDATAEIPSRSDVAAFRAEGKPWNVVVQVTERLRYLSGANLLELAEELIMPDKELQDRVFHLGVLGEILIALRHKGYNVRSIRPLSGGRLGPAYEFMSGVGEKWDLWFEAAGAWSYYKQKSPYGEAAKGVEGAGRALGSDILLIQSPKRALIIECKFSANPTYVARNGYEQVLAYAAEMKGKLATDVQGVVVGPQSVVATVGVAETVVGRVSIIPPSAIRSLAIEFIELDLSTAP